MNAFESVVAMLLRREGYWTAPSYKVELTKEEKRLIGRHSAPRWEIDLLGYKGSTNEMLAVECRSYLDSKGVVFQDGAFPKPKKWKLFTEERLRQVVLGRVAEQLQESGACPADPTVRLCLAAGKIARNSDREGMRAHFQANGWLLFDDAWVRERLAHTAQAAYENDVAFIVSKILMRGGLSS